MEQRIKVYVIRKGRRNLYLRFVPPDGGDPIERTSGTHIQRDAERAAARWEKELLSGEWKPRSSKTWEEFRVEYETHAVSAMGDSTAGKISGVFNSIENILKPARPSSLSAYKIMEWQTALRKQGLAETTIKSNSAHLKAALRWAASKDFISAAPTIDMPSVETSEVMRGRPINEKEFAHLLRTVRQVVKGRQAKVVRNILRSMYWGSLRAGETLALHWTDGGFRVDMSGRRPVFRIKSSAEKGKKSRVLPIAPEFARLLERFPTKKGSVFVVKGTDGRPMGISRLSRVISNIGKKSKIETEPGRFVTAHDLRRSFGTRWAREVKPLVLMQLMRHSSITTTQKYYVDLDAEETADILYDVIEKKETARKRAGDTFGDTGTTK